MAKRQQNSLFRLLHLMGWEPSYDRAVLSLDLIARITLWGLVVPAYSKASIMITMCETTADMMKFLALVLVK